jgi:hypothetical protein
VSKSAKPSITGLAERSTNRGAILLGAMRKLLGWAEGRYVANATSRSARPEKVR